MAHVRRRLAKIGNSWGVILPKEVLELLGVESGGEVDVELVGNTLIVTAPDVSPIDVESSLAYLASRRERAEVYQRLAE
jgi:putative addiction module antidote